MSVLARQELERKIVSMVVADALKAGYSISVDDGEAIVLNKSVKKAEILKAMFSTDEDILRIFDSERRLVGDVYFIYGNSGYDVIHDYSATPKIEAILKRANDYTDKHY